MSDLDSILNTILADIPSVAPSAQSLTPQQVAFVDAYGKTFEPLLLEAVAGSGKTFTLVKAASARVTPTLALAFNKRNAEELGKKMPAHVTCKTFNALGHQAFAAKLGKKLKLDFDKLPNIIKSLDRALKDYYWDHPEIRKLINAAYAKGLVPQGAAGLESSDMSLWLMEAEELEIEPKELQTCVTFAQKICVARIYQAWNGNIDFDDQLYMSVLTKSPFPKFNTVLVDEAQDLNPVQHQMLALLGGRVIAAGDPYQAIYGFRGALHNSLDLLTEKFKLRRMPLSVSFRCPRNVVAEAQKWVPHIEAAPSAPAGSVIVLAEQDADTIESGDSVICRTNAPLVGLFFELLRHGKPSVILGRDIGQGLKKLCLKYEQTPMSEFPAALDQWLSMEKANFEDKPAKMQMSQDRYDAIMTVVRNRKPGSVRALAEMFEEMFRDEKANITLGSIHKAKGMEWKRVHFYGFEKCPLQWKHQTPEEHQQEINLTYVAITRAQDTLVMHPLTKEG